MSEPSGYAFGLFKLETRSKRLARGSADLTLTPRQFDLLHLLVSRAGEMLSKDLLIRDAWRGISVTDNNLVQVVNQLRRILDAGNPSRYIQTEILEGYRFTEPVTRIAERASDRELEALIAPHRAVIGGCTALESLEREKIAAARATFERALASQEDTAAFHAGLANACVLQFETTRADPAPDVDALSVAAAHAREACRLNPTYGEAWAALGLVLGRMNEDTDARAALHRSVTLEPNDWRHQVRLSFVSWNQQRLGAAYRALRIRPDAPFAHWLAATVFVARQALPMAEEIVDEGIDARHEKADVSARFAAIGLHLLKGLLCLARGDTDKALAAFDRELALETAGHLYSRECAANTWYAIGACELRRGNKPAARTAFDEAISRVPCHVKALAGRALVAPRSRRDVPSSTNTIETAVARASALAMAGDAPGAARIVDAALASAPQGSLGWTLPLEPLLSVQRDRDAWTGVLARLRNRAA